MQTSRTSRVNYANLDRETRSDMPYDLGTLTPPEAAAVQTSRDHFSQRKPHPEELLQALISRPSGARGPEVGSKEDVKYWLGQA